MELCGDFVGDFGEYCIVWFDGFVCGCCDVVFWVVFDDFYCVCDDECGCCVVVDDDVELVDGCDLGVDGWLFDGCCCVDVVCNVCYVLVLCVVWFCDGDFDCEYGYWLVCVFVDVCGDCVVLWLVVGCVGCCGGGCDCDFVCCVFVV